VIPSLLALTLAASPACGLPPLTDGERPWRTGETLELELDVLGAVKAGTLQLSVERPMSGGRIVPLRARARTSAIVASIRRFAGVGLSWVDASTLLPERYRDDVEDAGIRKTSDARIPEDAERITIAFRRGDREGEATYDAAGEVLDALSAVYYLRAARLAPGDRLCFDVIASRRFWRFEGTVAEAMEEVETPAGRFETLRVDAVARRADRPDRTRPVHLWFTRDARRLLVAAVSETELGSVRAELSSVRGARQR
jgi:hypothetical protein